MKKIFTILTLLFVLKSYAQSYYKNLFDSMHYDTDLGYSNSGNQTDFSWAASAHMEALVLMYEKTHDPKYANTLIQCMGNVIDRRDDLRDQLQPPQAGVSNIYDYRGVSGAAWSTDHYNITQGDGKTYAHVVHSANITYPMAKFAAIIKDDSTIQNTSYQSGGRYHNMTFIAIADDLIQKVIETLHYHEGQWFTESGNIGYYKERNDNPPIKYGGAILPFNMQSAMGRVLVQMYRATHNPDYLTQLNQIANFIKANTLLDTNLGANTWEYWKNPIYITDDISHAGLTVSFPYECYKYNIPNIYTNSDILAYAKTLTKNIYQSPLFVNGAVSDNQKNWNVKTDVKNGTAGYDSYIAYRWLALSEYSPEIYQLIADLYAAENYYTKIQIDNLSYFSSLTIALLAAHEKLIVPTNTNHEWGTGSDWRGVANGSFFGTNKDEFAVIRNFDGMISIMKPQGRKFYKFPNSKVYGNLYDWRGIAAGDFFGDSKSEMIALSNHANSADNGIYVLKIENNDIIESGKITGWGADSDWAGVAAGNFISGGKDDFIVARNYNTEVIVYKFNGTTPQPFYSNALNFPANSKIAAIASGNLDSDNKDEIALLVNSPNTAYNGIHVYDIDDNGVMTKIAERTGWGAASEWRGLAIGDIDANGIDEIIAHRNYDGEYNVYKLNGSILDGIGSESFPVVQTQDNVMCFGNFDLSSQNDELVTLRKDGGIVMFSAAKVVKTPPNTNKRSDPCQDEIPNELFSFIKSSSFSKKDFKEIVSVK
ncbi:VCBS repeat-containing protein [Chryseobacterium sediminis]|uniref:VCBS repeat-containing protein n=1 Tax=Chryseobacterium sediminis TaxID=1679494 RepID=A0A5B2UE02_9FLAO|nr:VCBS repeat-containing protein [Chryseobacterium sediminis]KAA2224796.1 VCBS repeat-containing protein [Chryseobacterium sediminis]